MLRSFAGADPFVKTKLLQVYCLALYGSALWDISSSSLKTIEVAFNNILRQIWSVPQRTHTRILHCLTGLSSVFNMVLARSKSLICSASSSTFPASVIFREASQLARTSAGFNNLFGTCYTKDTIRGYRLIFGHTSRSHLCYCL